MHTAFIRPLHKDYTAPSLKFKKVAERFDGPISWAASASIALRAKLGPAFPCVAQQNLYHALLALGMLRGFHYARYS